jgi:peptidoglycan lytic transglycosylase
MNVKFRSILYLLFSFLAVFFLSGCGPYCQKGIACWYGKDFHGKPTASGEIYDMYSMTAAHRNLPFNTVVLVKDLDSERKVIVRINNRGPFIKGRVIDLSYAAAKKFDLLERGLTPCEITVLKWPERKKSP